MNKIQYIDNHFDNNEFEFLNVDNESTDIFIKNDIEVIPELIVDTINMKDVELGELKEIIIMKDVELGELKEIIIMKDVELGELKEIIIMKDTMLVELKNDNIIKDNIIVDLKNEIKKLNREIIIFKQDIKDISHLINVFTKMNPDHNDIERVKLSLAIIFNNKLRRHCPMPFIQL